MWDDVGILRTAETLARGKAALETLTRDIAACGIARHQPPLQPHLDGNRLNLENLTLVSRAICAAADFRKDSRGAHFREDFPQPSDLAVSAFTKATLAGGAITVTSEPVTFSRVRPGEPAGQGARSKSRSP